MNRIHPSLFPLRIALLVGLLMVAFRAAALAEEPEQRTWTAGQFSVEATYVKYEDGKVHLLRADGKLAVLPIGLLSSKDQTYVRRQIAAARKEAGAGTTTRSPAGSAAGTAANSAEDWFAWRGPNANGIANGAAPPTEWNETKNIIWRANVPGRGHSSPIVVGSKVLLTTADEQQQVQSVLCFDRATGRPVWKTDVNRGGFPSEIHAKNTHASPTLASDGELVFASFCHHDGIHLTALDLNGRQVWQEQIGPFRPAAYKFGYSASPLLYKGTLIVTSEFENGLIAWNNAKTGKSISTLFSRDAISHSSPIVGNVAGRDQMLLSGNNRIISTDPVRGNTLWTARGVTTAATCGTMVWDGDVVFASGGYPKAETVAVLADGSSRVLWRNGEKCYEQSMLAYDKHLYAVNDNGIAFCWDAMTGAERWKQRLGGSVSSSPVLAGGNLYLANERGTMFVFKASPEEFVEVGRNQLGDETFATPTICGGRIYLRVANGGSGRRQETLYCIGQQGAE